MFLSEIRIYPQVNKKFGIDIVCSFFEYEFLDFLNIEILGDTLYGEFIINIDIYNNAGYFLGNISMIPIKGELFDGISAHQIVIRNSDLELMKKGHIRIYPTNKYLEDSKYEEMKLVQVGINFGDRKKFVEKLKAGDVVYLVPDSMNEYDKFAVKVLDLEENHIGFLSSECAFIYNQFIQDQQYKVAKIIRKNRTSIYLESPIEFTERNTFLFEEELYE